MEIAASRFIAEAADRLNQAFIDLLMPVMTLDSPAEQLRKVSSWLKTAVPDIVQ